MNGPDDHNVGDEPSRHAVPRDLNEFQQFAAEAERADREGTLEHYREHVGAEIVDALLAGRDIDAELQHPDPKRREAAISIAMKCHGRTDKLVARCIQLAGSDKDNGVRDVAISLLGRVEGHLTAKVVPFLLGLIRTDREAIETRLCAYRSLVYLSGAVSRVRIPAVLARSIEDIDWGFVESCRASVS
jgi:hypothetical protein